MFILVIKLYCKNGGKDEEKDNEFIIGNNYDDDKYHNSIC